MVRRLTEMTSSETVAGVMPSLHALHTVAGWESVCAYGLCCIALGFVGMGTTRTRNGPITERHGTVPRRT